MSKEASLSVGVNTQTVVLAGMAILVAGFIYYKLAKGAEKVAETVSSVAKPVANAVNPASQTNIVQKVGKAIVAVADPKVVTQDLTLSTKVLDWFGLAGNDYDPNK